ncbi:MAG: response regulator [Lachnospiraceae bacterium]|nr:response regulator [Lachnospiraceae bacterium]
MKVLIVDDEPFITQGLRLLIDWEEEGFEIAGCLENGKEALQFLKENEVDLILTDIRMPELSGLDLMEQVKEEHISDAYFIIMSGYDDFGYAQKALRMGCVDYLLKPVDGAELIEILKKIRSTEREKEEDKIRRDKLEKAYLGRNMISRLIGTYDMKSSRTIICNAVLDRLVSAIEVNDTEEIEKLVHDFYKEVKEKDIPEESVNFNISYLLFQLIRIASEQDDEVNHEEIMNFISESSFEESLVKGKSDYMVRFCLEYAEYISQLRKRSGHNVLKDVEREIRERYAENISLREMSQKYYINNAYLGQLFKKKYGVSFKDYLTDYRIREAAKMLVSTDKKIISIAEDVGYRDSDYFVQKFIERMGCTPSKYRRDKEDQV